MSAGSQPVAQVQVDVSKFKILIGVPAYEGKIDFRSFHSLLQLSHAFRTYGIKHTLKFIGKESLIPRARNNFAAWTLQGDFTHLFFPDSDISFDSNNVIQMLVAD